MQLGGPKPITEAVAAAGGEVGPRSMWAGAWMFKPNVGYGGLDRFYAECKADGVQPLVFVWVIGDDDGTTFLRTGVQDRYQDVWKTRQDGLALTHEVAVRAKKAGVSPLIILNNEFNKGPLQSSMDFAKFYDEQVAIIRSGCPTAKIVFAPGAWGDLAALAAYYKPQVDKSDMVGLQAGFFQPRNPTGNLGKVGNDLVGAFSRLGTDKPRILYDVFLSTYGGAFASSHPFAGGDGTALEVEQAQGIASLATIPDLTAIVYRALKDNPRFDTTNYGGWAERYVGVVRADGTEKPGLAALMALAQPEDPCVDVKAALAASEAARLEAVVERDELAEKIAKARAELL